MSDLTFFPSQNASPDTVYAMHNTQTRLASDSADNILWDRYTTSATPELANALRRITFSHTNASTPLHSVLEATDRSISQHEQSRILVVVGRSRRMAVDSHAVELQKLLTERNATVGSEVIKTLGDIGAAYVAANTNASLLVLQATAGQRSV